MCILSHFSRGRFFCDPMDCRPPGSSVHEISQTRTLEWVSTPSSRGPSWVRDQICISCLLYWQMCSLSLAPPQQIKMLGFLQVSLNFICHKLSQIVYSLFFFCFSFCLEHLLKHMIPPNKGIIRTTLQLLIILSWNKQLEFSVHRLDVIRYNYWESMMGKSLLPDCRD